VGFMKLVDGLSFESNSEFKIKIADSEHINLQHREVVSRGSTVGTDVIMARDRSSFVNGLAIGFGVGFLATFTVLWISVFFTSQLSPGVSYAQMISVFIYPLFFLLGTGTVLLTTGIVREYVSPI